MDSTHVFAPKWLFQSNNGSLDTLSSKPTQTQYLRSNHHYNSHNDLNDRDFPSLKQDTWSSRSAAVSPARTTESVWSHSEARSKVVSPRVVPNNNNNSNGSIRKTDITMKRPVPVPLSLSSIQSRNVSSMSQRDTTTRNSRIVLNPKAPAPIILADVPVKLPASSSLPSSSSTSSSSSSATNSPRADFDDYRPRSRSSVDSSYHPHNSNNISSMNNNNNHSSSINGNNNKTVGFSSTAARLRRERELSGQEVPGAFHKTYSSTTTIDHHGYNQYPPPPPQHRHVFENESSRVRERASSTDSSSIRKIEILDEDFYHTAHEVETIDGHGDAWAEDSEVDRTPLQSISAVSSSSAKADVTLLTPEEDELLDHDEPNNLEVPVPTNIQIAEPIPIHPAPVPKHELPSTSSNKGQVLSESMEKEERFLRELGWQTPEDEEAPFLTAEEIETFASKLRVVRPSTNGDVRKATKVASKLALRSVKPVAVVSADAGDIDATSPDED